MRKKINFVDEDGDSSEFENLTLHGGELMSCGVKRGVGPLSVAYLYRPDVVRLVKYLNKWLDEVE